MHQREMTENRVTMVNQAPIADLMRRNLSKMGSWEPLAQQTGFQPATMAARCNVSLRQLERFFAENFHKPPKTWARELRCSLAKKLLAEGWTNKAVAQELQFTDGSHLCHEFKNLYGLPPRAFGPMNRNSHNVAFLQECRVFTILCT